jgi:hypothetical protein
MDRQLRHIKIFEDYSEEEARSLLNDLRSLDLALTEEEEDMVKFIASFGGNKSPEEYAEYLFDYYTNPEEFGIDTEGDYFDMITYLYENSVENHARFNLSGPMRMGEFQRWRESGIENEPLYKSYIKISALIRNK